MDEALYFLIPIGFLWRYRRELRVSDLQIRTSVTRRICILILLLICALLGNGLLREQWTDGVEWIVLIGLTGTFWILLNVSHPPSPKRAPSRATLQRLKSFQHQHGANSVSCFSFQSQKEFYIHLDLEAFIPYRLAGSCAVALGDPIGSPEVQSACLAGFIAQMRQRGLIPVIYQAAHDILPLYQKQTLKHRLIGQEAVIDIQSFQLHTPAMKKVRYGYNRIIREQGTFTWYRLNTVPQPVLREITDLYAQSNRQKVLPALSFSMNYFPLPALSDGYLLTVNAPDGTIWAGLSFLPYDNGTGMALDLMLRDPCAPSGVMDAAIVEAIHRFQMEDTTHLSLGLAAAPYIKSLSPLRRPIQTIFHKMQIASGYGSLYQFKDKYHPVWHNKYVVYGHGRELPLIFLNIMRVHIQRC